MAKIGIDISAHQDDIDLATLKAKNQLDFVIIRAGYGTQGAIDKKFKRNVELCRSLGIPVGFYWYSYALNIEGAKKEAKAFIKAISPYKDITKFGAWFDMEDADDYKKMNGMPSNQILRQMCVTFCEMVEEAGFYTGVYASLSWFKNQLKGKELDKYDKWVAQWPTFNGRQEGLDTNPNDVTTSINTHLWQFTSDGRFSGYNGGLDTNYAYLDVFPNPNNNDNNDNNSNITSSEISEEHQSKLKHVIDEVVKINGVYTSSDSDKKLNPAKDQGKITKILAGARNPYLLNNGDIGWVNDDCIIGPGEIRPVNNTNTNSNNITKGSRVKFTGTKSYSGIKLASWTHGDIFNVIEVSGDRIVIGKGTVVTAAVNIKDCEKI